ncbi:MAG: rhombosortase [Thalassolituus sp.]
MRPYLVWLSTGLLALLVFLCGDTASDLLRFDRGAIDDGQYWRFYSSHLTHLSFAHLILNLLALALTAYVADPQLRWWKQVLAWMWLYTVTGVGLWFFAPDLYYYVGLSGALHGALIIAIAASPFYSLNVRMLVIAVILGKVLWEQSGLYDDMGNAGLIGGRTETRAHFLGALAGILWVTVTTGWKRYERRKSLDN